MSINNWLRLGAVAVLASLAGIVFTAWQNLSGTAFVVMIGLVVICALTLVAVWYLTVSGISKPLAKAVSVANKVASGDLTGRIDTDGLGDFGKLMTSLKEMNDNLTRMVGDIRTGAEAIVNSASEVATGNANLSQRTEEQASTLQETASSMGQLTSAVRENKIGRAHV